MKWRRTLLVLLAAVAMGTAALPTTASARGGFRGGGRGWGRGFGFGPAIGLGLGLGLAGGYYGYGGGPYYYGGGPYYGGCWRRVVVGTPYGPRYRRVWVC